MVNLQKTRLSIGAPSPEFLSESIICDFSDKIYEVTNNARSTYTWASTGGTISDGQGTNMITLAWEGVGNGIISVDEETADGCLGSSEEFAVVIDDCTAIGENELLNSIKVSPNPASSKVFISSEAEMTAVRIFSLTGQLILVNEDIGNNQSVDVSNLEPGLYLIRIYTELGTVSRKLIIE